MKWKVWITLAAMLLTSCTQHSETSNFPGFTQIANTGPGANFYVDAKTINEIDNEAVAFKLLQVLPTGYAIQDAALTSSNQLVSSDGVKYTKDGAADGKFPGVTLELNDKSQVGLSALVKFIRKELEESKSFDGEFNDAKALQALYGQYRPDINGSTRKNLHMPSSEEVLPESIARVCLSKDFSVNGEKKHIIIVYSRPEDYTCHACSPLTSAAIFRKKEEHWELEVNCPDTGIWVPNGGPPQCSWEQIGADNWGLLNSVTDGNNGSFSTNIDVTTFPPAGPKTILNYSISFDDTSTQPDCKIKFHVSQKKMWDAIVTVKRAGSKEETETYVFENGEYKQAIKQAVLKPKEESAKTEGLEMPEPKTTKTEDSPESHTRTEATPVKKPIKAALQTHKVTTNRSAEKNNKASHSNSTAHKKFVPSGELDPRLFLDK
jgi:hypothetical protein